MKKLLLTLFTLVFMASLVSSGISDLGTFKKDQDIELIQVCECSEANITKILTPNGTVTNIDSQMSKDGNFFSYTLNSSQTDQIGQYKVNGEAIVSGSKETFSYSFTITASGGQLGEGQGTLYFGISIILLVLFGISLYLTITTPFGDFRDEAGNLAKVNYNKYLKFAYGFVSYTILMFLMFTGKGITQQFAAMDTAYGFFNVVSTIMVVAIGPVLIAGTAFVAISIATDKKNTQAIMRGLSPRK